MAGTASRIRRLLVDALEVSAVTVLLLLLVEGGLRALGMPHGYFVGFLPGTTGLYPASSRLEMRWGPIPYRVETNSLGFRGPEFEVRKRAGAVRIVTIGDSVTDGFFVDNDGTFPHFLRLALADSDPRFEVISAARGGGSIGKQLAILRHVVLDLDPDIVLLTFVTNDIADIRGMDRRTLVSMPLPPPDHGPGLWLVTRTAIGELAYDLYFRVVSDSYRKGRRISARGDARYVIPGGEEHRRNVGEFLRRHAATDGLILSDSYDPRIRALVGNYLFAFDRLHQLCADRGLTLGLVYFPSYPEVYSDAVRPEVKRLLKARMRELGVPFLDLTPTFRARRDQPIYLAPLDFHASPLGNRLMGTTVAEFVVDSLVPSLADPGESPATSVGGRGGETQRRASEPDRPPAGGRRPDASGPPSTAAGLAPADATR